MDVGKFLPVHSTVCVALWHRYMSGEPPYQEGTGGVPPQGDTTYHEEATVAII